MATRNIFDLKCDNCRMNKHNMIICGTCNNGPSVCRDCWHSHTQSHYKCSPKCIAPYYSNGMEKAKCEKCKKIFHCFCMFESKLCRDCSMINPDINECNYMENGKKCCILTKERLIHHNNCCARKWAWNGYICHLHTKVCNFCLGEFSESCLKKHLSCPFCKNKGRCCSTNYLTRMDYQCFNNCWPRNSSFINTVYVENENHCKSLEIKGCCFCLRTSFVESGEKYSLQPCHKEHLKCYCGEKICSDTFMICVCSGKKTAHEKKQQLITDGCIKCPAEIKQFGTVCCECMLRATFIKDPLFKLTPLPDVLISIIANYEEPQLYRPKCRICFIPVCDVHSVLCKICKLEGCIQHFKYCDTCDTYHCENCNNTHTHTHLKKIKNNFPPELDEYIKNIMTHLRNFYYIN